MARDGTLVRRPLFVGAHMRSEPVVRLRVEFTPDQVLPSLAIHRDGTAGYCVAAVARLL
jgi:hypothetical protein